ncbi:hypothetical protein [Clostridium estertheticum]|nr:hypothetical protein [Clostridium estertheticum]
MTQNIFHKLANKTVVEISSNDSMAIKLEPYLYIAIPLISTFLG